LTNNQFQHIIGINSKATTNICAVAKHIIQILHLGPWNALFDF